MPKPAKYYAQRKMIDKPSGYTEAASTELQSDAGRSFESQEGTLIRKL